MFCYIFACCKCLGKVTGPLEGTETWFTAPTAALTEAPTAPMDTYAVVLESVLSGGQYYHSTLEVPTCSDLEWVTIELEFDPLDDTRAASTDLQYVIEDPSKRSITLGGSELSFPTAALTTPWPDSMFPAKGSSKRGTFTAKFGIGYADLKGAGTWTLYHLNSFSSSGAVKYKISTTFQFKSGGSVSCSPTSSPSLAPEGYKPIVGSLDPPTVLLAEDAEFTGHEIPIPRLTLQAYYDVNWNLVRQSALLSTFPYTGGLKRSIRIWSD